MLIFVSEKCAQKKTLFLYFIVFILFSIIIANAQNNDSLRIKSVDSVKSLIWQPKILPDLNQFNPQDVSHTLQLIVPNSNKTIQYYNPKNVMPKNYWEMDYRSTSYYTPRIVSDKLAHIMNRPPPDSFVSLPTIALLAASIAMQYMDIQLKIEIKATDYVINNDLQEILISLWKQSPQTAKLIYKSIEINNKRTMETLISDLQVLIDKKLVKRKIMEAAADEYFVAQDIETARQLIERDLEIEHFTDEQRQILSGLVSKLSVLQDYKQ